MRVPLLKDGGTVGEVEADIEPGQEHGTFVTGLGHKGQGEYVPGRKEPPTAVVTLDERTYFALRQVDPDFLGVPDRAHNRRAVSLQPKSCAKRRTHRDANALDGR